MAENERKHTQHQQQRALSNASDDDGNDGNDGRPMNDRTPTNGEQMDNDDRYDDNDRATTHTRAPADTSAATGRLQYHGHVSQQQQQQQQRHGVHVIMNDSMANDGSIGIIMNGSDMDAAAERYEFKSLEMRERDDARATEIAMRLHSEDPGDDEKSHKVFFLGKRNQKFRDEKGDFKGVSGTVRLTPWKLKERMKTVSVGLVLCLNIGVDPPDVGVKPVPCAKLECWIDPMCMAAPRALEEIGRGLQRQYERWQPRARYKQCLDPTVPDVKKLCVSLRKAAKNDRVLLHYNGHGVPRPTANGEVWVFNKTYTQYIPLSIYDLHSWLGSPATLILDCSAAALVVDAFAGFVKQKEDEAQALIAAAGAGGVAAAKAKQTVSRLKECIIMASCGARDILPMNPDVPADLFTTCITDPLRIALRCFAAASSTMTHLSPDICDKLPGRQSDRKTPLGELNWIFTAITDTIAWSVLPRELFQKLFRQDLLVASLFRNFLLADRIMRGYGSTPVSYPKLPPTHKHPMWEAWDLAMEHSLLQLDKFLQHGVKFQHSTFFAQHLTAFEVWLEVGGQETSPPMQLPIVLQVLLSQVHRRRALVLLARFLGKGSWAVNLALAVGIFPYVLKLLQSPALELRDVLVFIWTKILAVDRSCQVDLVKDNYHEYFLTALQPSLSSSSSGAMNAAEMQRESSGALPTALATSMTVTSTSSSTVSSSSSNNSVSLLTSSSLPPPPSSSSTSTSLSDDRQRAMAGFVLSVLCDHHIDAQRKLLAGRAMSVFYYHMDSDNALLRRWMALCVAKLWTSYDAAKMSGVHEGVSEKLCMLLIDPVPEVRASSLYALGCFMGATDDDNPRRAVELAIAKSAITLITDGSAMVRDELVGCLAQLVFSQQDEFCILALEVEADDRAATPRRTADEKDSSSVPSASPSASLRHVSSTSNMSSGNVTTPSSSTISLSSLSSSGVTTPASSSRPLTVHTHNSSVQSLSSPTASTPSSSNNGLRTNPSVTSLSALDTDNTPPGTPASMSVTAKEKQTRGLATIKDKDSPAGQREMIWKAMLQLCYDPFPAVAVAASSVRAYVAALNASHVHRRHGDTRNNNMTGVGLHRISERWDGHKDGELHAMDDSHLLRRSGSGNNMRRASSTQALSAMNQPQRPTDDTKVLPRRSDATQPSSRLQPHASGHHPSHHTSAGMISSPSMSSMNGAHHSLAESRPSMHQSTLSSSSSHSSHSSHESPEQLKLRIPESLIYNRSCDHFIFPVLDPQLDEEKNFQAAINRQWRAKRNIRLMEEAKQLKRDGYGAWSFNSAKTFTFGEPSVAGVFDQTAILQTGFEQVSKVIFHPFENMLFASDGKHNIGVWDFKEHIQLNLFARSESPKLTSLQLINPHDTSLLMTGADDGVVKLWRNTHIRGEQEVCAAWTAIKCPARGGCALVLDWQQNLGRLLAAGHSDVIRIWDAEMDTCIRDMPLQGVNTSVTALCSTTEGHVAIAGCLDGSIRMYDTRRESSLVASSIRHSRRCVQVHLQRGGFDDGKLISGGAGGEVIMTDLRMTKEALKTLTIFDSKTGKSLDALAVHDWAPILACGSSKQVIKVVDTHGTNINTIKYYKGFMGQRIGAIRSLAFHPHQLMLAAGANNSFISLLAALPNG